MLEELLARRLLIVLGKGGVGKTTVCAALARAAVQRGLRTLVMECDAHGPINAPFGVTGRARAADASSGVSHARLDGGEALEEYLKLVVPGRALLNAVFASRLYQLFVQAAPGLKELMMLGKVCYELEQKTRTGSRRWNLIVVDAPASGQALALLRMPFAARATFGESIVGREAHQIGRVLRDTQTSAVIQVTTPEALAVSETLETFDALVQLKLKPASILFNRHRAPEFDERDITSLIDAARGDVKRSHLKELARAELARRRAGAEELAMLCDRTGVPVIEVRDYPGLRAAALAEKLASDLARKLESRAARRASQGTS